MGLLVRHIGYFSLTRSLRRIFAGLRRATSNSLRLYHTVRYLKPIQILARVRRNFIRLRAVVISVPSVRVETSLWRSCPRRTPSLVDRDRFCFLNIEAKLDEVGWGAASMTELWRYNLHYFDDLVADESAKRKDWHTSLLCDWIENNPPGKGVGWAPYPTSLRIVNWIKWSRNGGELSKLQLESLATQAEWLSINLEWHLLGNHLFVNAKALIFAGLFYDGREASSWLNLGVSVLNRQIGEQFLADGGQFELSPMYHSLAMEDLLDIINIYNSVSISNHPQLMALIENIYNLIPRAWHWLTTMTHPDCNIALFNDSAFGIAPTPIELADYANRLGIELTWPAKKKITWLRESGYARVIQGDATLFVDIGEIGPAYLPGHAHADNLGFELSLGCSRIFVDTGTSVYGIGEERLRQRGTQAHNTVWVEGHNSSDVWSGFRVGARALPLEPKIEVVDQTVCVKAGHSGYCRLNSGAIHRRRWALSDHDLTIFDSLPRLQIPLYAMYHLHPDVIISAMDQVSGVMTLPTGRSIEWRVHRGSCFVEESTWHPKFGVVMPSRKIVVRLTNGLSEITFRWD